MNVSCTTLPGEVDLWIWNLEPAWDPESRIAGLSTDEVERAGRFVRIRDRHRFIVARAGLRAALAGYVASRAGALRFTYGTEGKPSLKDTDALHFNLSHSGEWAALAVCCEHPVGLDIERIRPLDIDWQGILAPAERQYAERLPSDERLQAFYRAWTRKEAVVKAHGVGFSVAPDTVVVGLSSGDFPYGVVLPDEFGSGDLWQIATFRPLEDLIGAVAAPVRGWTLRERGEPPF